MHIRTYVDNLLVEHPRNHHIWVDGIYVKRFRNHPLEMLNILGGKKVSTQRRRFLTELGKNHILQEANILVPNIIKADYTSLSIIFENIGPFNYNTIYVNSNQEERSAIRLQLYGLLRQIHEAGVVHGDPQLRNFVKAIDQPAITDLEADWMYNDGHLLDLIALSADMFAYDEHKMDLLGDLERNYGRFKSRGVPLQMQQYYRTGYNVTDEFLHFFDANRQ